MEENKILEFVKEFNKRIEIGDHTPYNLLKYQTDGYSESISIPDILVFNSDNDSSEFFIQNTVSSLVLSLEDIYKNAKKILDKSIKEFIAGLIKDNNIPRYELSKISSVSWKLIVGEEFEDIIWNNDFTYLFPGCKLHVIGDEKLTLALPDELEIGMYCITKSGKTVQIEAHDMRDYPYTCFKRVATNAEIEEYKRNK